jgi:hypothetical protein
MVVAIYEPGELKMLAVCDGPDTEGQCPRITASGAALCAGCDIVLSRNEPAVAAFGPGQRRFRVYDRTVRCPLASPAAGLRFVHPDRGYFSPFVSRC